MRIGFVSSYPPRKCGIATYTKDLGEALHKIDTRIAVVAMENGIPYTCASPVIQKIRQEVREDYLRLAAKLNRSSLDIVHLQHEFGLFGGNTGEYVLDLAQSLSKSLITTFHTVLLTPSPKQKEIIQELTRLSRKVIVMEQVAKERLVTVYGLNPWDIAVVYHGVPEISNLSQVQAKKKLGFENTFLVLANNLLSRNKGIEYAIAAVAQAKKDIPNVHFLMVGETHPTVKRHEGESYRQELEALVIKKKLQNHVQFINEYVSLENLIELLAATDVYITPYLDPQQITSGTLSYAIGAGKVCIATKYIYAQSMLANGRGLLVPFHNSRAIAQSLVSVAKSPEKRKTLEKNALNFGKKMRWPKVAEEHAHLYTSVLEEEKTREKGMKSFLKSPLDISHMVTLTDPVGIMQHTIHTSPDKRFGYSTDDVARALIVTSQIPQQKYAATYLSFLQKAQEKNGMFHNFLTTQRKWKDTEDVSDTFGRALWGLGYFLSTHPDKPLFKKAENMFIRSLACIASFRDVRARVYTLLGLTYFPVKENLIFLATFLCKAFEEHKNGKWQWFEDSVTYDNFRFPQALFQAFRITENKKYKTVAEKSLQFLTKISLDKKHGFFDFVGQNGWHSKDTPKALFDQQPLEAGGAVEAYLAAYQVTKKKIYRHYALLAYSWFFGNNKNHRVMIDSISKGIFDGLTPRGVNENEGAESILCFLMATVALKKILPNLTTEVPKHLSLKQLPNLLPHLLLHNKHNMYHPSQLLHT